MRFISITILSIIWHLQAFGQDSVQQVMPLNDYINVVIENHPAIKQANLLIESADAGLRQARGNFDPKLKSSFDLKNFKGKEYYDIFNTTLQFQTNSPITPKIGLDRNEGIYLNAERTIPDANDNRQLTAGISLPIGKGLLMDERRLALRQAKLMQDIAVADRVKMVNKIVLKSLKAYWDWYMSYRKKILLEQSLDLANNIFERVMLDYQYGELAVIDTIQAQITRQTRQADYETAVFELIRAQLALENFLWSPDQVPVELQPNVIPDINARFGNLPSAEGLEELKVWAMNNHPEIQKLEYKINSYELDRLWYREALKPQIDLSYSFIDAPIGNQGELNNLAFSDNYKLGLDFSFPLFLRKERGKLQRNKIKIRTVNFELSQKQLEIKNSIESKFAETQMSRSLSSQFEQIAENYNRLLEAEFLNLETGASDLFKINIQQDKLIQAQIKFLKNLIKFEKNKAEILYETGVPFLDLS